MQHRVLQHRHDQHDLKVLEQNDETLSLGHHLAEIQQMSHWIHCLNGGRRADWRGSLDELSKDGGDDFGDRRRKNHPYNCHIVCHRRRAEKRYHQDGHLSSPLCISPAF